MYTTFGALGSFDGSSSSMTDYTNGVVYSDLDTYSGQSGSSVWSTDAGVSGAEYYVRALVNAGDSSGRAIHNTIRKFNFDWIKQWKYLSPY